MTVPAGSGTLASLIIGMVPDIASPAFDFDESERETKESELDRCICITCVEPVPVPVPAESVPQSFDTEEVVCQFTERVAIDDPMNSSNHPYQHVSSLKSSFTSTATATTISTLINDDDTSIPKSRFVCFSTVEIRSYGVTLGLGETPTLRGPPIMLDWSYDAAETQLHDVDTYEYLRTATPENPTPLNPRRTMSEPVIPPSHREYRLMQAGFSRFQIFAVMEEAQRSAKLRENTTRSFKRERRRRLGIVDRLLCRMKVNDIVIESSRLFPS